MSSAKIGILMVMGLFHVTWSADPKVTIQKTYPYTTKVNGYKTIIVEKDHDCFLDCVFVNKPSKLKVFWLVQNFDTDTTIPIAVNTDTQEPFKYQIDKPASNNYRLRIKNVQTSDNALFTCQIQLGPQQITNDSRIISVVQVPQIIDTVTSSDTTAEEGDKIELMCGAQGIPKPVITWQRAGGGVLPTGGREYTSPTLHIDSAHRDHKGYYKCIAQNKAGTDIRRIYLNVKFQPQLITKATQVFGNVGSNTELQCQASGNPIPSVQQVLWYREGVPLDPGGKYQFKSYFGSNYVLMGLIINDVSETDFGQYRCYAENSEGNGQNFVQLVRSYGSQSSNAATPRLTGLATPLVLFGATYFFRSICN